MKAEDIRTMSADQLKDELLKLKKEQFNLRFQKATGQLENTARIRQVRRDVARIKTQQRAAAALDGVQTGVDLVRAVDTEIESCNGIERHQRNPEFTGEVFRPRGRRHAGNGEAPGDAAPKLANDGIGGRTRAQAHGHSGLDQVRRRIEEAAKFIPVENLAVSTQCGFASTQQGNLLTWDEQKRKLELVAEVARKAFS